jgi:hypothetical protein
MDHYILENSRMGRKMEVVLPNGKMEINIEVTG